MSAWLPLFVAGPLLAAVLSLVVRPPAVGRALVLLTPALVILGGGALVAATSDGTVIAAQVAGWPAGIAIPFVADLLSALMLVVSGMLVLASVSFALRTGHGQDRLFAPLVLMMTSGVYGAYLTADLFNLFVMIEVALLPSYVLLAWRGTPGAIRAARLYLTVNLTASTLFLIGLGAVYGTAGTVNLAALAGAGATPAIGVAVAVVLVALSMKGGLVPTHTWLPATYPQATPAITALFSGLLTKIGVYALIRVVTVVYDPGPVVENTIIVLTVVSMVVGVLGALGEGTVRGVLAFHMVSQVGYILVGLALAGPVGLAAVVFYLVHHTVVKTSLFLSVGAVEVRRGTGRIGSLGAVAAEHRWVALAFLFGALSLTGIPPFSGFWAKFGVLSAALAADSPLVFAAALLVSVGTLMSMLKLGTGVFWGEAPRQAVQAGPPLGSPDEPAPGFESEPATEGAAVATVAPVALDSDTEPDPEPHERRWSAGLVAPGLILACLSLAVGLYPEPLLALTEQAGATLGDPSAYVEAVLGR
ncbi:MAG: monovalent cation/H+ antiporter subunit D family protein [Candidatus Nanopelagicales bacterium]